MTCTVALNTGMLCELQWMMVRNWDQEFCCVCNSHVNKNLASMFLHFIRTVYMIFLLSLVFFFFKTKKITDTTVNYQYYVTITTVVVRNEIIQSFEIHQIRPECVYSHYNVFGLVGLRGIFHMTCHWVSSCQLGHLPFFVFLQRYFPVFPPSSVMIFVIST